MELSTFINQFKSGVKGYSKAIQFLSKNKLFYFFFYPLIFNLLLFLFGIQISRLFSEIIGNQLNAFFFINNVETIWWGWLLSEILYWAIWLFSKIIFLYLFTLFAGYITIICLSPVFCLISEKTAEILTGKKTKFEISQFLKDIIRAVILALRNIIVQFLFSFLFLILSFIPVIGWAISIIGSFLIGSYFYGFAFIDYSSERHKLPFKKSILYVRKNKGFSCGLGSLFYLCFLIPIVGGIIASFLAIICVVNATIEVEKTNSSYLLNC